MFFFAKYLYTKIFCDLIGTIHKKNIFTYMYLNSYFDFNELPICMYYKCITFKI